MKKYLVAVLLIVALLCSCGNKSTSTTSKTDSSSSIPKVEVDATTGKMVETFSVTPVAKTGDSIQWPAEPINISVWYSISGTNGDFFKSQVEQFAAQNPNIKIEATYTGSYADSATKISAAKMSNKLPDMAITSSVQLYPGEDGNISIDASLSDPELNVEDIQSGIMEYANYMGYTCSLPFAISTPVMYYNKDLAEKAGYDLEKNPPKTWDEFIVVAKAIADATGNKSVKGFDTSDSKWLFKSMLKQNGNDIVKQENGKITPVFQEDSGIEVANFWKRLVDEKVMSIGQHDNAENKFLSGQLAFISATSNRSTKWATNATFKIGAIPMPYFKEPAVALGGSTVTIMTTDQWKYTACWELIKYLLNTENQADFALTSGYLPIRKSSLELDKVKAQFESNSTYKVAADQLEYAFAYTMFGEMGSMDMIITYALDDIENGSDPVKTLKSSADELLNDLK